MSPTDPSSPEHARPTDPAPSSPGGQRVRIVTDSACDLPDELVAELGIEVVPLTIRIGEDEFVDREELSADEFWERCKDSPTLPSTAAPSPGQFEAAIRRQVERGATSVVVIDLSAALSATMQSAELAARALDGEGIRVSVVDSRSVTLGLGAIVTECATLAASGASHDAVVARAEQLAEHTKVWGALDTLDNLRKGGRIGGAKALLASALAIKPIIEVRDGKVEQGGKQRTRSKALAFLVDKVREQRSLTRLFVLHAACDDVDRFVEMLREATSAPIVVGQIGPVVGSHAGRGTIGVAFTTAG